MKKALITATLFALPAVAFAQQLQPIRNLIRSVGDIVAMLIPILITLALVAFFYGLFQYIWGGAKKHKEGAQFMAMSLIALFVMVSVWGLVRLIGAAVGVNQESTINIPTGFVPR